MIAKDVFHKGNYDAGVKIYRKNIKNISIKLLIIIVLEPQLLILNKITLQAFLPF